jgi:hypothetical protein
MSTYLAIMVLFTLPLAVVFFSRAFFFDSPITPVLGQAAFTSPFAAVFNLPINMNLSRAPAVAPDWWFFASFMGFYALFDGALLATISRLFAVRWRMDAS